MRSEGLWTCVGSGDHLGRERSLVRRSSGKGRQGEVVRYVHMHMHITEFDWGMPRECEVCE